MAASTDGCPSPGITSPAASSAFPTADDLYTRPLGQDGHGYRRQLEGWADTILHGRMQWGASVHDGLASMRAIAAIARSAATGGDWVALDHVTGGV